MWWLLPAQSCGLAAIPPTATTSRYESVARGAVYESKGWLSADLTSRLRADGASLLAKGAFRSSGLSNTARGDQGFGASDRSVLAITPELGGDVSSRAELEQQIDQLRLELSAELQRPGLVRTLLGCTQPAGLVGCTHASIITVAVCVPLDRSAPSSITL